MSDEQLTEKLAEKVMGWGHRPVTIPSTQPQKLWRPLESMDHAMMLVDAMRQNGWRFVLFDANPNEYMAGFRRPFPEPPLRIDGYNASPCRAICEAALLAVTRRPNPPPQ